MKDIIGHCTSHTSSNKQIESLRLVKNVVDINDPTSIEFSSRVLSEISLNNMYVQLFEIKTNFDSHQYNASLADGIDFKKAGYPVSPKKNPGDDGVMRNRGKQFV